MKMSIYASNARTPAGESSPGGALSKGKRGIPRVSFEYAIPDIFPTDLKAVSDTRTPS